MKTHTSGFKNAIKTFGRELDSKITYTISGVTTELGNEELNSVSPHYEGAILKSVMKQLDIDSNVEIPIGTELNYQFGVKVRNNDVLDYRDNYDYIDYGNYIVKDIEKQEDMNSYKITCYDKMLYSMKEYKTPKTLSGDVSFSSDKNYYEKSGDTFVLYTGATSLSPLLLGLYENITYPITIRNYINAICDNIGLTFANISTQFANYDKTINEELYLDTEGNTLNYTFRDVLDELAEATASTICINNDDELEIRYISDTNDTIDEEYLKDINVNFGEKFGAVNTIILSRGGDGDKISLSQPTNLPDADKIAIQISDNQIMNGNDRDTYMADILSELYGLEYYINDFVSTGICYYDLCDKYNITIDNTTYNCIMFNDNVEITQGLQESIYTDLQEENEQEYKYMSSNDRGITQANIIAKKNEATITETTQKLDNTTNRLNAVETKQTETDRTINIISTHIDKTTGEVTEVTTTTGFTFNAEGMSIKQGDFEILQTPQGAYYKEGSNVVGQYTKDGSKQKDLSLFGAYYYGMADIDDTPMFVAQLYTDKDGEEAVGHFYNRS